MVTKMTMRGRPRMIITPMQESIILSNRTVMPDDQIEVTFRSLGITDRMIRNVYKRNGNLKNWSSEFRYIDDAWKVDQSIPYANSEELKDKHKITFDASDVSAFSKKRAHHKTRSTEYTFFGVINEGSQVAFFKKGEHTKKSMGKCIGAFLKDVETPSVAIADRAIRLFTGIKGRDGKLIPLRIASRWSAQENLPDKLYGAKGWIYPYLVGNLNLMGLPLKALLEPEMANWVKMQYAFRLGMMGWLCVDAQTLERIPVADAVKMDLTLKESAEKLKCRYAQEAEIKIALKQKRA